MGRGGATHKGVSYSQQYVQTLVMMGTVVSLIMLIMLFVFSMAYLRMQPAKEGEPS